MAQTAKLNVGVPAVKEEVPPPTKPQEVAGDDELAQLSGQGSENVRGEDLATPFLAILQSNSPECKRSNPGYVQGAEEGMGLHTISNKLYDLRTGVEVIDCFFEPLYLKWKPRDQSGGGGGFHGSFSPTDPYLLELLNKARPKPGRELTLVCPDGDELVNQNQHYILLRAPGGEWEPLVLGLGSTQIKKSRNLNALLANEKVRNSQGLQVPIPRFGVVWKLTSVVEQKDTNTWFGVNFERQRRVNKEELELAKQFHSVLNRGERRAKVVEERLDRPDAAQPFNSGQNQAPVDASVPY